MRGRLRRIRAMARRWTALRTPDDCIAGPTRRWQPAMQLDDLWVGELEGVDVGGTKVLLVNVDGQVRAYRNRCPHRAWALDGGELDGKKLTCPRHRWVFNVCDGRGIKPRNYELSGLSCKIASDGMIWVDVS